MGGGFERPPGKSSLVHEASTKPSIAVGKRTLTEQIVQPRPGPSPVEQLVHGPDGPDAAVQRKVDPGYRDLVAAAAAAPVQRTAGASPEPDAGAVQQLAAQGVAGPATTLPHRPTIQSLFGRHDVSGVQAHVGGAAETASRGMGAEAYATGNHVAFAGAPSLHTAAHEAAHVIQQRAGVQLKGGVGAAGDQYEQHADAVADAVIQGKSAEALLDRNAGGGGGATAVQRQAAPEPQPAASATEQAAAPGAAATESPTQLTPDDIAEEILRRPEFRADFLEYAERANGAAFRDAILAALEKRGGTAAAAPAAAPTTATTMPAEPATAPTPTTSATPIATATTATTTPAATATAPATSTAAPTTPAPSPPAMTFPAPVRVTSPDGLRVRRTASAESNANVAGGLHRGVVVTALAREGDWLRIEHNGQPAFVFAAYVEPVGRGDGAPAAARVDAPAAPIRGGGPATPPPHGVEPRPHAGGPAPQPAPAPPAHGGPTHTPTPASPQGPATASPRIAPAVVAPAAPQTTADDAYPSDERLAAMARALGNPNANKIMTDLAAAVVRARTLNANLATQEFQGEDRENFVAAIGVIRAEVDALDSSRPGVAAFQVAINHRLEALSPYHAQVNIRTIETGDYTTCNVTSLAMSLETIGKNADSYSAAKRPQIVAVARVYRRDVSTARLASHGTDPTWESLRGLRLPDFMELAAIANRLHGPAPTDAEIRQAGVYAAQTKTNLSFLVDIAGDFGANATGHTLQFDGHAADLERFADREHAATDSLVDLRNKAEANPRDQRLRANYETNRARQGPNINGGAIEQQLPLETYKATVIREVGQHLDAGAGVVSGTYHHFTHTFKITNDHIMVQDPGLYARSLRKVLWDEARALQYFWNYIVIK